MTTAVRAKSNSTNMHRIAEHTRLEGEFDALDHMQEEAELQMLMSRPRFRPIDDEPRIAAW